MEWWIVAFLKIVLINIILSGDNAIVIAMASRNLPESQRRLAIFWGAFGASTLRILLTVVAIYLLKVPYLTALGAILLIWLAFKLILEDDQLANIEASNYLGSVIITIILADFVMSLDNVLAIAAVAEGKLILILLGLLLSIPLIIWGSTLILHLLEKFPILIYLGAAVLGFTAGEMFIRDQKVMKLLTNLGEVNDLFIPITMASCVVVFGWIGNRVKIPS